MNKRIQELINRKPTKWGNVSIKTFEQDIKLITYTVAKQRTLIDQIESICKEYNQNLTKQKNNDLLANKILHLIQTTDECKCKREGAYPCMC